MFPAGLAGVGLLLVRFSVAAMLLMEAFPADRTNAPVWQIAGASFVGLLICLGIFTPLATVLCGSIELAELVSLRGVGALHVFFALVLTVALGLLGPGAFSMDAKRFGRRLLVAPKH
jgi:hypothetical protein